MAKNDELIEFEFPVRSDLKAFVRIPKQFTGDDLKRLQKFIALLPISREGRDDNPYHEPEYGN